MALLPSQLLSAQLRIEECYDKAEANYPLIKRYGLIQRSEGLNLSAIGKGYLPQFDLSAKATYQSAVTKIPLKVEGVKGLSKDQYDAQLNLRQQIWDGGQISAQKRTIKAQAEVDQRNVDVALYQIRQRVNDLFLGAILCDGMLQQNTLFQDELARNYTLMSAYKLNGIANQSDLDAIEVEQIKAKQNRVELVYRRKALVEMLSALIGEEIGPNVNLIKPELQSYLPKENRRPELALYAAQRKSLDAERKGIHADLMPQFYLYARGGYGKPGLNMLEDKFSTYYLGGVAMSWNFGSLYTRKSKINNLEVGKLQINVQEEVFLFNNRLDQIQSNNELKESYELLKTDDDIIRLRGSVKRSAEAALADGALSTLDFMKEVNAEQQAIQQKIIHEIELIQAIYKLKYITKNE